MKAYYADITKHRLHAKSLISYEISDKQAIQTVSVIESVFGVTVDAQKHWSPLCQNVFTKEKANGISLGRFLYPWNSSIAFVNDIPECKNLSVTYDKAMDFSSLTGNPNIEGLELKSVGGTPAVEFDFSSLPNLRRCCVMLHPNFMSVLKCEKLVSLWFQGGMYDGVLFLDHLPALEEFVCREVKKLQGIIFAAKARLRALDLTNLKLLEQVSPLQSISDELLTVTLQQIPRMNIEWLAQAKKIESIGLGVGKISTIKFLKRLKNLQAVSLFGSKVLDGDLSIRDSLKSGLDARLWGCR